MSRLARAIALLLAGCSPTEGVDLGGTGGPQCVEGATVMCWCDGVTPGAQECLPDNVFGPCVCDRGSTGAVADTSGDGSISSSGGAVAESSGSDTTADSTGAQGGCTPEMYAAYMACHELADLENPEPCDCTAGNLCENIECALSCPNIGLEEAREECANTYRACAELFEDPPNPRSECLDECQALLQTCYASGAPDCEDALVRACNADYGVCAAKCPPSTQAGPRLTW